MPPHDPAAAAERAREDEAARVRAKLARLAPFAADPGAWVIEPLGGALNRHVRLSRGDEAYVLRLAAPGSGRYVDRGREAHNATLAAAIGLAPELVAFDPADGTMVTRYLPAAMPLDGAALRDDPALLTGVVDLLARLHRSGCAFRGRMALVPQLDAYLELAAQVRPSRCELLEELRAARRAAEPLRAALEAAAEAPAPCHVDPAPHNVLRQAGQAGPPRLWLLDWEYSAMAEPLWDLAYLAAEAELDPAQELVLLRAHDGTAPAEARLDRLRLHKAILDLLSAAWAALQLALGSDRSEGMRAFAAERLARARAAMAGRA